MSDAWEEHMLTHYELEKRLVIRNASAYFTPDDFL